MHDLPFKLYYEHLPDEPRSYNLNRPRTYVLAVYWHIRRFVTARTYAALAQHCDNLEKLKEKKRHGGKRKQSVQQKGR
jgi:hypothetical protein